MTTARHALPNGDAPLSGLGKFFRESPAIAGTVLYLWVAGMGMIYSVTLFGEFGINIFDFAEPADFILAAFKEPFTMMMAIVTVAVIVAYVLIIARSEARRKYFQRHETLLIFLLGATCIAYTLLPARFLGSRDAHRLKTAKTSLHVVHAKGVRGTGSDSVQSISATLVGTTSKFLIFYDHQTHQAFALPTASVQRIDIATDPWVQVFADSAQSVALDTTRIDQTSTGDYLLWFETRWAQVRTTTPRPFNRALINSVLRCQPVGFKTVSVTVSYNDEPATAHVGGDVSEMTRKPWKTPVPRSADEGSFTRACAIIAKLVRPTKS